MLPRLLSPVLLGAGNVAIGISGLVSQSPSSPTSGYLQTVMSLDHWAVSFIVLGLLILSGPVLGLQVSRVGMVVAVGWWVFYAVLIEQTISSPLVTASAVVKPLWIASLHVLLAPYWRKLPQGVTPCDGT